MDNNEIVAKVADFGLSTKKWIQLKEENEKRDVQSMFSFYCFGITY